MTPATIASCDEHQVQLVVLSADTDTQVGYAIAVTEEHTLLGDWFAEHHCLRATGFLRFRQRRDLDGRREIMPIVD